MKKENIIYILLILFGLALGIAGPFIIIMAYNEPDKAIYAPWEAADVLSYYGTLLGAIATIVAVTLTINYSRKSAYRNRIENINAEYRKIGIDTCLKMLNIFDIQTFEKYKDKTYEANSKNSDIVSHLDKTVDEMDELIKYFRRVYRNQKYDFEAFSNWYYYEISDFITSHSSETTKDDDNYDWKSTFEDDKRLRNEHRIKYREVKMIIVDTMTTYDEKKY